MKYRQIVMILVIFFSALLAGGQTRDELRRLYGEPENEKYLVRPGIVLQLLRSKSNEVGLEYVVEPKSNQVANGRGVEVETISAEQASELIDEIVPALRRGPYIRSMTIGAGATQIKTTEYKNAFVTLSLRSQLNTTDWLVRSILIRKKLNIP